MNEIFVVIDYQKDFVDGALGFEKAKTLEKKIYEGVKNALESGKHVFFTLDTHTDNYMNTREGKNLPVLHCIDGGDGHRLYGSFEEFYDKEGVTMVKKSGFGSSTLADIIRNTCGAPDVINMCGVVTNMCVIANAIVLQTEFENADIRILSDMCASFDDELHNKAIDVMKNMHMIIVE